MFWSFLGSAAKGAGSGIAKGIGAMASVANKVNQAKQYTNINSNAMGNIGQQGQENHGNIGIFDYIDKYTSQGKPMSDMASDYATNYLNNFKQKFQGISSMFSNTGRYNKNIETPQQQDAQKTSNVGRANTGLFNFTLAKGLGRNVQ